jgi:DNA-binding CsgD family transcriptional regulator
VARRGQRTLTIWHRRTPDGHVLLMEERTEERLPSHVARWGLTPREVEVLAWVAQGKTSAETALIIGIRPRTVDKHLERIFTKLGVENRTAAAALLARRPIATG